MNDSGHVKVSSDRAASRPAHRPRRARITRDVDANPIRPDPSFARGGGRRGLQFQASGGRGHRPITGGAIAGTATTLVMAT